MISRTIKTSCVPLQRLPHHIHTRNSPDFHFHFYYRWWRWWWWWCDDNDDDGNGKGHLIKFSDALTCGDVTTLAATLEMIGINIIVVIIIIREMVKVSLLFTKILIIIILKGNLDMLIQDHFFEARLCVFVALTRWVGLKIKQRWYVFDAPTFNKKTNKESCLDYKYEFRLPTT